MKSKRAETEVILLPGDDSSPRNQHSMLRFLFFEDHAMQAISNFCHEEGEPRKMHNG
jgi:hypothetical protein